MSTLAENLTFGPFRALWYLMGLPPTDLAAALVMLGAFIVIAELVRIALGTELTRSVLANVLICLLTFPVQAGVLAVVLVHANLAHPERVGWNFAVVLGLYVLWFLTGSGTKLVRPVSEGADLGFMTVGGLLTFPFGLVAVLIHD